MLLKCPKDKYEWEYTGEKSGNERVTCPSCFAKVKISENRID